MDDMLTRLRAACVEFRIRPDGRLDFRGGTPADHEDIRENRDAIVEHLRGETRARELLDRIDTLDETDLDRLVALGIGYFDDADLERLNRALARRHGLDFDEIRDAARAFDRPPEGPIRL